MPLYNITEKRLKKRRRQEEDQQDLEEALKQLQQLEEGSAGSDGSEEGSKQEEGSHEGEDEDSEDEDEDEEGDESYMESVGTMDSEDDSSDEEDDNEVEEGDEEPVEEDEEEDEDDFDLTILEVATRPIYELSAPNPSGSSSCVVCPGRLFKNDHMIKEHLASKAHKRGMKRWQEFLAKAETEGRELEGDPRELVEEILDNLEARIDGKDETEKDEPKKTKEGERADIKENTPSRKAKPSKKQRKETKARQLLQAATNGAMASASHVKGEPLGKRRKGDKKNESQAPEKSGDAPATAPGEVTMNRKARRMAAKQGVPVV